MRAYFIDPLELYQQLGTTAWPVVVDVCRAEKYCSQPHGIPTARWFAHSDVSSWGAQFDAGSQVVVACVHGHNVSQLAVSALRARGVEAQVLRGGVTGWIDAGLPTVKKAQLPGGIDNAPSRWVTRLRPKVDRIACPWLIRRFIDRNATVLFVEPEHVAAVAAEAGAVAFDTPGAPYEHDGPLCTFDTMIRAFGIKDRGLSTLQAIVRGADTARLDLAPEAAGLLAVALGCSHLAGENDHRALEIGFPIYDALYAWARHAHKETHSWPAGRAPIQG